MSSRDNRAQDFEPLSEGASPQEAPNPSSPSSETSGPRTLPHILDVRSPSSELPPVSLRDIFAAAALTGLLMQDSAVVAQGELTPSYSEYATDAYELADEMLLQRDAQ